MAPLQTQMGLFFLSPDKLCSLTSVYILQWRGMPEFYDLFIEPITEMQERSKDIMGLLWNSANSPPQATCEGHKHLSPSATCSQHEFGSSTWSNRRPVTPAAATAPLCTRRWWCSAPSPARRAAAPTTPGRWTGTAPQRSLSHSCQKEARALCERQQGKQPKSSPQSPCVLIYYWQPLWKYLVEFSAGKDKMTWKECLPKHVELNIKCKSINVNVNPLKHSIELFSEIICLRFQRVTYFQKFHRLLFFMIYVSLGFSI